MMLRWVRKWGVTILICAFVIEAAVVHYGLYRGEVELCRSANSQSLTIRRFIHREVHVPTTATPEQRAAIARALADTDAQFRTRHC